MLSLTILIALGMATPSQQAGVRLPAGVKSVSFGQAQRYSGIGKEMCAIVRPLPSPAVFERGVTEISYAVELEPRVVKSASARVVAPAAQELSAAGCNLFTPVKGGFSQTQLGNTLVARRQGTVAPGPVPAADYRRRTNG